MKTRKGTMSRRKKKKKKDCLGSFQGYSKSTAVNTVDAVTAKQCNTEERQNCLEVLENNPNYLNQLVIVQQDISTWRKEKGSLSASMRTKHFSQLSSLLRASTCQLLDSAALDQPHKA